MRSFGVGVSGSSENTGMPLPSYSPGGSMQTKERKHQILICKECGEEFVFPVSAQDYFAERGYQKNPKRCKSCHSKYKRER
ncbi:MAG TPA: zinc-ribbon domain containing protein [candidate division Zixibacteria bacterium]|jgi:hypothetical protein